MNKSIDTIIASRKMFMQAIENLSIDDINNIPKGFNNNIIWNFGHIIITQQALCYKLSGLALCIDNEYIAKYSKGTKPEKFINEQELLFLKEQSLELIDKLNSDLQEGVFENFNSYTTSFGVQLNNIDDSIQFVNMHDGLHLGYAMALKKAINN